MGANFNPIMGDYVELKPFRFWCQKVLPLVYDESLSYYELLCKVVDYLNKTMEDVDTLHTDVDNLNEAYELLQTYVNDYFVNLDVQEEINNKLDEMVTDGTLITILAPTIADEVAEWLSEHITPTTPTIDNTLTVSGAGADAKVTGDKITELHNSLFDYGENEDLSWLSSINEGKYIGTDGVEATNSSYSHTDFIEIPQNAVKILCGNKTSNQAGTTNYQVYPNVLFYDNTKTMISYGNESEGEIVEIAIPATAKYCKVNEPSALATSKTPFLKFVYRNTNNEIDVLNNILQDYEYNYFLDVPDFRYEGQFSSSNRDIMTSIILRQDVTYAIVNRTQLTGNVLVYGNGDTTHSKKLNGSVNVAILKCVDTDRYLRFYAFRSNSTDALDVEIYVLDNQKVNKCPEIYVVDNTEPEYGQYTSLTQCLLDLKDNENEKIIYINGGTYNIYQEYQDANVPIYAGDNPATDFYDYCVWIPKNTHIIGRGNVILSWMPDPTSDNSVSAKQCKTVSPINVSGSCTIENVEIRCKNGRYCIHDDPQKNGDAYVSGEYSYARKIYKNVRCYKYANDTIDGVKYGYDFCLGFGCHKEMHYLFENCIFYNRAGSASFYGHTENNAGGETIYGSMSSNFELVNCVFDDNGTESILLHNVTSTLLHCLMNIINCYLSHKITIASANPGDPGRPNAWDLMLLNCGSVTITCDDSDNPYIPRGYNTTIS